MKKFLLICSSLGVALLGVMSLAPTITPGGGTINGGGGLNSNQVYVLIQTTAPTNGGVTANQAAAQIASSNNNVFAKTYLLTNGGTAFALSLGDIPKGFFSVNSDHTLHPIANDAGPLMNDGSGGGGFLPVPAINLGNSTNLNGTNIQNYTIPFVVPVANATSFGIVPGLTNADTALQLTLNYVGYSNNSPTIVHIPAGEYWFSNTLNLVTNGIATTDIRKAYVIEGAGRGITILHYTGSSNAIQGKVFSGDTASHYNDITIKDLTLLGPHGTNTTAIGIFVGYDLTNPRTSDAGGWGLHIENCTIDGFKVGALIHNMVLTTIDGHCELESNWWSSATFTNADTCYVLNNALGAPGGTFPLGYTNRAALEFFGGTGATVINNEIGGCSRALWDSATPIVWAGNNIEGMSSEALYFEGLDARSTILGGRISSIGDGTTNSPIITFGIGSMAFSTIDSVKIDDGNRLIKVTDNTYGYEQPSISGISDLSERPPIDFVGTFHTMYPSPNYGDASGFTGIVTAPAAGHTNIVMENSSGVHIPYDLASLIAIGGSQTPWTSDIDAAGHSLTGVGTESVQTANVTNFSLVNLKAATGTSNMLLVFDDGHVGTNAIPTSGAQSPWTGNIDAATFSLSKLRYLTWTNKDAPAADSFIQGFNYFKDGTGGLDYTGSVLEFVGQSNGIPATTVLKADVGAFNFADIATNLTDLRVLGHVDAGSGFFTGMNVTGGYNSSSTNTLIVTATGLTNLAGVDYLVSVTAGTSLKVTDASDTQFLAPVLGNTFPLKPGWKFTGTGVTGIAVQFP